jgi:Pyridoxamine 5'-phosphate oxidase
METWGAFGSQAPGLASFGRDRIDRRVSFLGTVRGDGGPRVHPVTPWIVDGHLYVRMYPTSPKVTDLRRDPRFALHSMMDNDAGVGGEFSMTGRAHEVTDPDAVATAIAVVEPPGSARSLVLFEFGVHEALATDYVGDETERRRWRASGDAAG